jgi:hypothetical protein
MSILRMLFWFANPVALASESRIYCGHFAFILATYHPAKDVLEANKVP